MFDIFNMLKKEEHKDAKQVTRETIIGDILDMDQTTAPYFMEIGMHCLGCPASRGESIEEACAVHGVDCDELIEKLNEHLVVAEISNIMKEDGINIISLVTKQNGDGTAEVTIRAALNNNGMDIIEQIREAGYEVSDVMTLDGIE